MSICSITCLHSRGNEDNKFKWDDAEYLATKSAISILGIFQTSSVKFIRHVRVSFEEFYNEWFWTDRTDKEREFFFVYTSYIFSRFFFLKLKILELEEVLLFVYVFRESRIVFLSIRRSHFKIWSNLYKAIVLTKITITCSEICKQQVKQVYSYF